MNRSIKFLGPLILLVYLLVFLPKDILLYLTREDHLLEYLTSLFFLLISISFLLLFLNSNFLRDPFMRSAYKKRSQRYVFLLLSIVFFFGFGEEISWGQRIIGFATPDNMADTNIRNEFNIHNLELFSAHKSEQQDKSIVEKLLTMKQLFIYCFVMYLFIMPLLSIYNSRINTWFKRLFIPIPDISLGKLFIGNYLLYRLFRIYTDTYRDSVVSGSLTELQEFNFSIILLLLPLVWLRIERNSNKMFLKTQNNFKQ